jgi:hypothetical protein
MRSPKGISHVEQTRQTSCAQASAASRAGAK